MVCVLVGGVMEVGAFTRLEVVECTEAPALISTRERNLLHMLTHTA